MVWLLEILTWFMDPIVNLVLGAFGYDSDLGADASAIQAAAPRRVGIDLPGNNPARFRRTYRPGDRAGENF